MAKKFKKLRTGVIGVGAMGQNHARIYNEISDLVAIADPNEQQGKRVAEKFGAIWYSDYKNMLDEVDAVSIAVPTIFHREVSEAVSKAGVSLLVEKPLAGNVADAKKIISSAEKYGVTLAVGHVERHNAIVRYSKKCIDNGDWGQILTFSAKRFSNYPLRIHDVGVLFDLTVHDVDIISYLSSGNIREVYASGGMAKNKLHEDYVNLIIEFEEGYIGLCETNWLTPMKVRELNITTTECYVNLNYLTQEIKIWSSQFGKIDESNLYQPSISVNEKKVSLKGTEPLKSELVDFLESIRGKKSPLVTGEDGLKSIEIVEAGLRSIKRHKNKN